jgi:transcriptional regulator with XRE-family HTH domain
MSTGLPAIPKGRTLPISGDAVKILRVQRGWSIEELANAARCSVKTIQNVEHGARTYLSTLVKIAEAFNVPYHQLLGESAIVSPTPAAAPADHNRKKLSITINVDFSAFDETKHLPLFVDALRHLIAAIADFGIGPVTEGTVVIAFEMWDDDTLATLEAFCATKLDELGVIATRLNLNPEVVAVMIAQEQPPPPSKPGDDDYPPPTPDYDESWAHIISSILQYQRSPLINAIVDDRGALYLTRLGSEAIRPGPWMLTNP